MHAVWVTCKLGGYPTLSQQSAGRRPPSPAYLSGLVWSLAPDTQGPLRTGYQENLVLPTKFLKNLGIASPGISIVLGRQRGLFSAVFPGVSWIFTRRIPARRSDASMVDTPLLKTLPAMSKRLQTLRYPNVARDSAAGWTEWLSGPVEGIRGYQVPKAAVAEATLGRAVAEMARQCPSDWR